MSRPVIPADDEPHDVLAAEAFAVPASDPALHRGPVVLPDDPTGITEPHDVLAAEEFAMPAVARISGSTLTRSAQDSWRLGLAALAGALAAFVLLRMLRRR
jgi:hypothetical protein